MAKISTTTPAANTFPGNDLEMTIMAPHIGRPTVEECIDSIPTVHHGESETLSLESWCRFICNSPPCGSSSASSSWWLDASSVKRTPRLLPAPVHPPAARKGAPSPDIEHYNRKFKRNIESVTDGAAKLLMAHDWPGNVRERPCQTSTGSSWSFGHNVLKRGECGCDRSDLGSSVLGSSLNGIRDTV